MAVSPEAIEKALILGDLAKLDADQKIEYYNNVCKSLGLNPLTKPFDFISLNNKLQLYAKKDATDQLRRIYQVSVTDLKHTHNEPLGLYVVTAVGQNGQGRLDAATGAVSVKGMAGEALANAIMKAESKAKRRLTLSLVGLGMLDETEIETVQPEQMLTIKDGQIEVPADVKVPEPKPKKEPKKKEIPSVEVAPLEPVQKTDTATGFEFGQNAPSTQMFPQELIDRAVQVSPESEATSPASPITDADLPSVLLDADKMPTADELKAIGVEVKKIVEQGKMNLLGKYLKKKYGKASTKELTSREWAETLENLGETQKSGKLDELLAEAK